jgi:malate synthase
MTASSSLPDIQITGSAPASQDNILSAGALQFLQNLHNRFNGRRIEVLQRRTERQREFDAGALPGFLPETRNIREGNWSVAPPHPHIADRRVEITGPAEAKMIINALNSGARCFMADFEDSLSPLWANIIEGQKALYEAIRGTLRLETPEKTYTLKKEGLAQLLVRPRGWHLPEKHLTLGGEPLSGALVDFGLYAFHNLQYRVEHGSGLFLYLPKMESHHEAGLWADIFTFTEDHFGVARGSIRATVLIETITAAFEMDEILYVLREHSAGLNAGRWDYIFSAIKKFSKRSDMVLPDRGEIRMTVPFMKAYAELLVKTCHQRGAHAMGGMSAFIPVKNDEATNEKAFAAVRADKEREAGTGFDGTWVAHPGLISIAQEQFDKVLGDAPHQIARQREDVTASEQALLALAQTPGSITLAGIRNNIDVAIQYIDYWLAGTGAAAIHNLMEDAATAEISRAQLWQWIRAGAKMDDGKVVDKALYEKIRGEELSRLQQNGTGRYEQAAAILDELVLLETFEEFLTLPAYRLLD